MYLCTYYNVLIKPAGIFLEYFIAYMPGLQGSYYTVGCCIWSPWHCFIWFILFEYQLNILWLKN